LGDRRTIRLRSRYNRVVENIDELIKKEEKRQGDTLSLIPSENYASRVVREAMGSVFANKYAEGYPGKRYYQGNGVVDEMERDCQEKAKKLFGAAYANVQPLSGAAANLAILWGLRMSPEDVQLSQHLSSGGHLSMGQDVSVTSVIMRPEYYHLTTDGQIDWEELETKARQFKPRIIWSGGTAYTKIFDWEKYRKIADEVGAYFVADISHIGGLVAGGVHPSPMPYADVVMTTTHKSFRGPRGAMIMVSGLGLKKDPDLAKKIDKGVFPGVQGGPHMETVAALSVALDEAGKPEFNQYAGQVVKNAKKLAEELLQKGYQLVGGGTENHMVWIDLTDKGIDGWAVAWALESAGLIVNRQTVPGEKRSAYYPSGIRLGTPAVTTRGMKEKEITQIAEWIDTVIEDCRLLVISKYPGMGSGDKNQDQELRKRFKQEIAGEPNLQKIKQEVAGLGRKFPIPD
jgi:glycine hydroxymethyltransferase